MHRARLTVFPVFPTFDLSKANLKIIAIININKENMVAAIHGLILWVNINKLCDFIVKRLVYPKIIIYSPLWVQFLCESLYCSQKLHYIH